MYIDRSTFRDAMARFGAAVTVVTTDGPAGKHGLTCTAVCSVTDEPATVLVCVHRDSRINQAFRTNLVLCVNLLNAGQSALSAIFAGQTKDDMEARFRKVGWSTRKTGAPVFEDAVATLDCRITEVKEFGTHTILFARVCSAEARAEQIPLMYFNRGYHALATSASAVAANTKAATRGCMPATT